MSLYKAQTAILVVDDDEDQCQSLANLISSWGYTVQTAFDGKEALEKLALLPAKVVVTDLRMPRMDGSELLRCLAGQPDRPVVIVVTAFGDPLTAISMVHDLGAFWYVEKPIIPAAIRTLIERAAAQTKLADETARLHQQVRCRGVLGNLVARSPAMQRVVSIVRQAEKSRAPVLITGESGTGKEIVARTIQSLSPGSDGSFVAVNCAALPESLVESELFGHEKGAFTGAFARRAGCFELAQHGTLLLDEIADMPIAMQAKLLRVLEDSRIRRLGGNSEIDVDVRIIASTNKPIEECLRNGELREDLYYRLNVFQIRVPPLRDRIEDLPVLCKDLLGELNDRHGCRVSAIEPEVMQGFRAHHWPGNVRELRNTLERAVVITHEGAITRASLPPGFKVATESKLAATDHDPELVELRVGMTIDDAQQLLTFRTLEHTKNNKTRAAEILGLSTKTLFNKLKKLAAANDM